MDGWIANVLAMADVRPGERVLVVSDAPVRERAGDLAIAVRRLGADAEAIVWGGDRPLRHAPPGLLKRTHRVGVLLVVLSELPGEDAGARFSLATAVTALGGRAVLLTAYDDGIFEGELSAPAPALDAPAGALLGALRGARELHLNGTAGTQLRLDVHGRRWRSDLPPLQPGGFGSFPYGGVFCTPHRAGADGVLVVDASIPGVMPGRLQEPVALYFTGGRVVGVEGGEAAGRLRALIDGAGPGADVVAEVGIGLNPDCAPRGHVFVDEKSLGTAHVAIGRNTGAHGGHNDAAIHVDCIFAVGALYADGRHVPLPV